MGGYTFAKSKGIGYGSSFYFCVPHLVQCESFLNDFQVQPSNTFLLDSHSTNIETNKKILFADDNPTGRKVVKLMLEKIGFEVTTACDGKEAEELYFTSPNLYCCVVLDYEMPIQNGISTTKAIRKKDSEIPIVILTAHSTEKDREESMECGANQFLTKPVTIKDLSSCIQKLLHNKQ